MRKTLHKLHKSVGLLGALYMLMMSITGTLLLYREIILNWALVPNNQSCPAPNDAALARMMQHPDLTSITNIKMPTDSIAAYQARLPDKSVILFDCDTLTPLPDPFHIGAFFQVIFDLHHYLLSPSFGDHIIGIFGIMALGLTLVGMVIWWPWRRGFSPRAIRVKKPSRTAFRAAHINTAIIITPLLILCLFSGLSLVYGGPFRDSLAKVFGGEKPTQSMPFDTGLISAANAADIPVSAIRFLQITDSGNRLRLKMPEEWHPNGRTMLIPSNPTAEGQKQLTYLDARQMGLGHRLYDALYPLHSARGMNGLYLALMTIIGLATSFTMLMAFKAGLKGLCKHK